MTAKPPYWGTRLRSIRIPDELWTAAMTTAKARDETVSAVVNRALERYVARHRASVDLDRSEP